MGRQLEIDLSDADERAFMEYLRASADIQVIKQFGPSTDDLFLESLEPRGPGCFSYYFWNRAFSWEPEFSRTRLDIEDQSRCGLYYVSNMSTAPVLEYTRAGSGPNAMYGRIYWGKLFSAPNGVGYDLVAFEEWYEKVCRWLRKAKVRATRSNISLERTRGR